MNTPIYLKIDLSTGKSEKYIVSEEYFQKYLGGKTLACKLLLDMTEAGIDPLSPEAMIIINTGPMNNTGAPSSSRFNLSFKNVLTGGIASSNCGGQFGVMLKRAGYDGLILTGKANKPSVIEIVDGEFFLKDGKDLWGLDMEETQQRLPKHYGKLVIGPAGENLVKYASAGSGERMAGRCGAGAVLGSKNIKAVIAYGTRRAEIFEKEKFQRHIRRWVKLLRDHPMTGESLPKYGTAGLLNKANATFSLPTHNFKVGHSSKANYVSGETLAKTRLIRNSGCISCPIRCERRVKHKGKEIKGPEFETLGFFGPNIDSADLDAIINLNYICDLLGMDTISVAASIAFAMELKDKGIMDFGLSFGDPSTLEDALYKIANREGIYSDIADGTKAMSEKYGGEEFAMHSKGLELASYEPRRSVGMGLGYATSNRGGCHLNGGYLALLESVGVLSVDPQSPKSKAELTVLMQNVLEAVSSAGFCLFTAQAHIPKLFFKLGPYHPITRMTNRILKHSGGLIRLLLKSLSLMKFNSMLLFPHAEAVRLVTGIPMYTGSFIILGERSFNLERLYNLREGLAAKDDSLPDRLTKTPQIEGEMDTVVPLDTMLPQYYKVRGWDENGVPREKTIKRLGIE
ncbi:MAG TPA: aldehyde ferredoxin oxidoreductase family protein [Tepidimicrobium sp.]|nr:aldehyde ferredoxin oxidoreductase family protein [Tepidimicrobium sp.]